MKSLLGAVAALSALGVAQAAGAPARPYGALVEEAQAAFAAEDYAVAAARLDEAQIQRPYSLFLTRNRILARVLSNDMAGAVDIASGAAARGIALDFPASEAFDRLRADLAFAPVAQRFEANKRPIGESIVAAEFAEPGLLPEAALRANGKLYIGSVRTGGVFEASAGGLREVAKLDGGVFDLAASPDGSTLVAVVNNQLAYDKAGESPASAAIVALDRSSGSIRSRTEIAEGAALLGDIEADGATFYASDSLTPRIFAAADGATPSVLAADARFVNLQGLALDRKRRRLFVADYLAGLFVVDLRTNAVAPIANPTGAHLGGIDGLYLYKGDLVGVQNGTTPQRIVHIDLDKKGAAARKLTVLQQALPEWNEPTHGFVDGDRFIYIATSNWPAYGEDGKPIDGKALAPLRLMAVDLN
jgi:hypothetical protein